MTINGSGQWVRNYQNGSNSAFHGATIYTSVTRTYDADNANHVIDLDSTWGSDPYGYVVGDGTLKIPTGEEGIFLIVGSVQANTGDIAVTDAMMFFFSILTIPFVIGGQSVAGPLVGLGAGYSPRFASPVVAPPSYLPAGTVINLNVNGDPDGFTPPAGDITVSPGASITYLSVIRLT